MLKQSAPQSQDHDQAPHDPASHHQQQHYNDEEITNPNVEVPPAPTPVLASTSSYISQDTTHSQPTPPRPPQPPSAQPHPPQPPSAPSIHTVTQSQSVTQPQIVASSHNASHPTIAISSLSNIPEKSERRSSELKVDNKSKLSDIPDKSERRSSELKVDNKSKLSDMEIEIYQLKAKLERTESRLVSIMRHCSCFVVL